MMKCCIRLENRSRISILGLVYLSLHLALVSCNGDEIVARVDGEKLTQSEMTAAMSALGYDPKKLSDKQRFVKDWADAVAWSNTLKERNPNNFKLAELRAKLLLGEMAEYYLLEEELKQIIDTSIQPSEIDSFLKTHREEFELQDYIVQALFLKIPKKAKVIPEVQSAYLLRNDKDLAKIESYAKSYAEDFYFDDVNWIYFSKLESKLPAHNWDSDQFILNRSKTYLTDDNYVYFINILDYKFKNDVPPMDFVRAEIRERILMDRANKEKEKLRNAISRKLKEEHEIEIYI